MWSLVGVLRPDVGGLGTGVRLTEEPLMSMEAEVREESGVSIVEGIADTGGDCDFPLATSTPHRSILQ